MFQVSTDGLRRASYNIRDGSIQLNRYYHEIEDVKNALRGLSSLGPVIRSLSSLQDNVRTEANQEQALFETAQMIAAKYESCEEAIADRMDNGKFGFSVTGPRAVIFRPHSMTDNRIDTKVLNDLLKLFN